MRSVWNKGLTKETDSRVKGWSKGLTKETDERVKRISERLRGQAKWIEKLKSSERRKKLSDLLRKMWQQPEMRVKMHNSFLKTRASIEYRKKLSVSIKKALQSPKVRRKMSNALVKHWKDPVFREKILQAKCKANSKSPNNCETKLLGVLNSLYPNDWKFVGNGAFWITYEGKHCNPDFVNCNGKKLVIEFFGDYWHQGDDESKRQEAFESFGYKMLIIWERELKNIAVLEERIKNWVNEVQSGN